MIPLILFVALGITILILFEVRARKQAKEDGDNQTATTTDEGCCGQHLVCERETLLQTNAEIIYYDDEELDELAGIDPKDYTDEQHEMIASIFESLMEKDVPGWCRSLQLRNITLPPDIREEALMVVQERRKKSQL